MQVTKPVALGLGMLIIGAPFLEAVYEPAENCRVSSACSWGMSWSPDEPPEQHHGTRYPVVTFSVLPRTTSTTSMSVIGGVLPIAG